MAATPYIKTLIMLSMLRGVGIGGVSRMYVTNKNSDFTLCLSKRYVCKCKLNIPILQNDCQTNICTKCSTKQSSTQSCGAFVGGVSSLVVTYQENNCLTFLNVNVVPK